MKNSKTNMAENFSVNIEFPFPDDYNKVVYFFDHTTMTYKYMSSDIIKVSGYSMEELNKLGFSSVVREKIKSRRNSFTQNTGNKKEIFEEFSGTYVIETKDNKIKWIEDNSFTKIDNDRKRIFSIGVLRDITDFRDTIFNLIDNKKRLDAILKLADVAFLMIDNENKISLINGKGRELFGVGNIIGENSENLFTDRIMRSSLKIFKKFITDKDIEQKAEIKFITSSGEEHLILWQKTLLRDEQGNVNSIIAAGHDITEKKKEENIQKVISQVLQAANVVRNLDELFKFIHKSVSELMLAENFYIALYDREKNMISFPYFIDKYDKDAPPIKFGKGLTEYVITYGKSALVDKELDAHLIAQGEIELIGPQSEIWLGVPLKIRNNTIGAMVVQDYENKFNYTTKHKEILEAISHPISMAIERKKVEQEREKLIEDLSELNQSKDRLFSLISHDLRSPFNSLLGFSEILNTEYNQLTDDEIKEYLNVIYESSKNLYGMTNNLLQYSRFQTGRIEYKPEKLNLTRLIKNCSKMLSGNIVKKEINFKIESDPDAFIFADEDMMNSVIQNFVSNAIKFTPIKGTVTASVKCITAADKSKKVKLTIEDTGIGITDVNLRKIMNSEMFSTPGTEREYGTGLGMVLIKEFIQRNGGELKIKTEKNKGTCFIAIFPQYEEN